jgi:hypothetical protein
MAHICSDTEVAQTLFEILETQRIVEGKGNLTLLRVPAQGLLTDMLVAEPHVAQAGARTSSGQVCDGMSGLAGLAQQLDSK